MSFEQEKMIVGSLPSLYPLQKFEEEAINALVSLSIDDDTISRKATTEAIEKCHKQCCRIDSCGDEWIHYETTLNEVESIPPMPSNTSNALKALNSVNTTQFNALDSISRRAAKDMIKNHKSDFSTEKDYRTARACVNAVPPAQPEKRTKERTETHACDSISRQAVADAINRIECTRHTTWYEFYQKVITAVEKLPPAEPKKGVIEQIKWERDVALEQLKELGYGLGEKIRAEKDCISRQAAIDYFVINVGFHDEDGYPIEDTDELRKIWTEYFDGIPPVEPKRIRGRWITDKQGYVTWSAICNKCGERTEMVGGDYNFCPHCGADMREVTE